MRSLEFRQCTHTVVEETPFYPIGYQLPYNQQSVNSSLRFLYLYADITFSWRDVPTDVYEQI